MARKGIAVGLKVVLYIVVALLIVLIVSMVGSALIERSKAPLNNKDPSSGYDTNMLFECEKKCNDALLEDECTKENSEIGMSCKTYIENANRKLFIEYPHQVSADSDGSVTIKIIDEKQAPIENAAISDGGAGEITHKGEGIYEGTLDLSTVESLIEKYGKGYVVLLVQVETYASRKLPILVKTGPIEGNGNTGGPHIILKQEGKKISTIKPGIETEVLIEEAGRENPPSDINVDILQGETNYYCDLGVNNCIERDSNNFTVPVAALEDGIYTIRIIATYEDTNYVLNKKFSWSCPKAEFEDDVFGPGKTMSVIFESPIKDKSHVTIKLNGATDKVSDIKIDEKNDKKISFKLPRFNDGIIEGDTTLRIEREGTGKGVLCIYTDKNKDKHIMNFIEETYDWSCTKEPDKGCYFQDPKYYVLTGKSDSGEFVDYYTGCRYSNKAETPCDQGCTDGICDAPKLVIREVLIDGKKIGSGKMYEDLVSDRIIKVVVENTGTLDAKVVEGDVVLKIGSKTYQFNKGPEDDKIVSGQEESYEFWVQKEDIKVELVPGHLDLKLYIEVKASNADTKDNFEKTLRFYSCRFACEEYNKYGENNATYCNACTSQCVLKGDVCEYACGDRCNTYSKSNCVYTTCPACEWDSVADECVKKKS